MSYEDSFDSLWGNLDNADGIAKSMDFCGALVEVPNSWFALHELKPVGRQSVDRATWLLTEDELWNIWRKSNPKVRWKEVV